MDDRILWKETRDYALAARLCEKWNSGRLYEILWEYSRLRARTLVERKARSWLCYEGLEVSGVALGRKVGGRYVFEELWAPFDGLFGDTTKVSETDVLRVEAFESQVLQEVRGQPVVIRGATDNVFAHGVARVLKLPWFNGMILAERALPSETEVRIPEGYALRDFIRGDEGFFSSLYRAVYSEEVSPRVFRDWATKDSCRTTVASAKGRPVGFIIAEKRPYGSLGDFAIAVSPEHHRRGVGGALLRAGLDSLFRMGAKRAIADYRSFNGATHALYEGSGFRPRRVYNYFWGRQRARLGSRDSEPPSRKTSTISNALALLRSGPRYSRKEAFTSVTRAHQLRQNNRHRQEILSPLRHTIIQAREPQVNCSPAIARAYFKKPSEPG